MERRSAWSIKRMDSKAEKRGILQQKKNEGQVAAVTAEDLQQLSISYITWISILGMSSHAEHEQSMLGKLVYADDPIFKNYYIIDRPGVVYVWDKKVKMVVFTVHCSTTDKLFEDNHDSSQSIFMHLHNDSTFHGAISNNGSRIYGRLWGFGWPSAKNISIRAELLRQSGRTPSEQSETPRWRITPCPPSFRCVAFHIAL